jgi:hypothetical protein
MVVHALESFPRQPSDENDVSAPPMRVRTAARRVIPPAGRALLARLRGRLKRVLRTRSNPPSMQCNPPANPEKRVSPYDSATASLGTAEAKLCYSRPYARGRVIFGGLVPYDTLWRTGANEPTILHLSDTAEIAGIPVKAGSYSIYTVPNPEQWTVVVNSSTSQWGLTREERGPRGNLQPNAYIEVIRAQEEGRAPIMAEGIGYVEQFTAHFDPSDGSSLDLHLDWERTRATVPIRFVTDPHR